MITRGLSCDRVEFGHFGGGSDDPPDPPLATGLIKLLDNYLKKNYLHFNQDMLQLLLSFC